VNLYYNEPNFQFEIKPENAGLHQGGKKKSMIIPGISLISVPIGNTCQ
jgi:hypothetical protein